MIPRYDPRMATAWDREREKEREATKAAEILCGKCDRMCEPIEVQTCSICKTLFCNFCSYRIGSANYCSRACGDAFFFGGVEEDDPED